MAMSAKQKKILNDLGEYIPALKKGQIGSADGGDIKLGDLMAEVTGGDFKADGSVPMTGDLDMDGNEILNATIDGVILDDGSVPMDADLDMDSNKIVNLASGTDATDAMAFGQILVFNSGASAGGAATEALTVTGLLSTDTILAVTQKTKGANNLPLLGWSTQINDGITGIWSANPGASAVVSVAVKR